MFVDVILPLPLEGFFTYHVPEELSHRVKVGQRVLVPLGKSKRYIAIVAEVHNRQPADYDTKPIADIVDDQPVVLHTQLRLWQWMAEYYMSPLGDIYKAALPTGLKAEEGYRPKTETFLRLTTQFRSEQAQHVALDMLHRADRQLKALTAYLTLSDGDQTAVSRDELINDGHSLATINALIKRGIIETYEVEVGRLNYDGDPDTRQIKQLNAAQQDAYNKIQFAFLKKQVVLLHGVTASGKTEIYIHLIQQAIDRHEQVLYLLPEIALTVQMMDRLRRVFGSRLGIYHSKYSDAERVEIWQKQLSAAPYDVILGARSAVFLPFRQLGLVIVDEEHETSFKQQDPAPRYHARDAAIMLAQMSKDNCSSTPKVLLGTATPCAETWQNAQSGKYGLVSLTTRYQDIELPEIQVVDIGKLSRQKMMTGTFSPLLLSRTREALERGEQVILFQNRRGYAPIVECRQCGWVPDCQQCDVSLTMHRLMGMLACHYCGAVYQMPQQCPACGSKELRTRGYGTEKIETEVRDIFPEARVARMDLDTTRSRHAYEHIISDFAAGRTNLLIGTQMVSKGLDFDKVSVVGIVNADTMLNVPDFRAYEHAFMMMSQVSGRAGRKGRRGLVVLQTRSADLPVVRQVVGSDFKGFYADIMAERRQFHYPPFFRIIYVYLKHKNDAVCDRAGQEMGSRLRYWFGERVLGPDKPPVAKVKSLAIRKIVLKLEAGIDMKRVRQYLRLARKQMEQAKAYGSLQIYFDVDPL